MGTQAKPSNDLKQTLCSSEEAENLYQNATTHISLPQGGHRNQTPVERDNSRRHSVSLSLSFTWNHTSGGSKWEDVMIAMLALKTPTPCVSD